MGDPTRGLYGKFIVRRRDETDEPGGRHYNCDYFVLDLTHDKYAIPAIASYAEACRKEYPLLARDLDAKLAEPREPEVVPLDDPNVPESLVPIPPSPAAPAEPLIVGARVWLNEDIEQHNRIVIGTVRKVSTVGYVIVTWDEPNIYPESHFSPATAATALRVVAGDDALPRHDWDCQHDQIDPACLRCGVTQTDENEFSPCSLTAPDEPLTQQIVSAMNADDWPRATRLLIQHLDAVNRSHVIQQAALRWAYDHLQDSPLSFRAAVARLIGDKPGSKQEARDE